MFPFRNIGIDRIYILGIWHKVIGCPISDACWLVLINIIFSDPTLFKDVPSLDASILSRISVKFPYA